jgi:hypothetical protein
MQPARSSKDRSNQLAFAGIRTIFTPNQPKPPFQDHLALEALRLKEEAKTLPPSRAREAMLRKARQIEIASHVNEWLSSTGLQPPR